jgi:CheY-like chemotaxis protein
MSKSIQVLLVEDSEADRCLFEAMLEELSEDVSVIQAFDGEQARCMLVENEVFPSIIFLDINMPKMDGHEFLACNESLLTEQNVQVYMLSSSGREQDKAEAASYSCVKGYIEKPCTAEVLASALYYSSPLT